MGRQVRRLGCIMKLVRQFIRNASGATAIEYGLVAGLIAVTIMVGAGTLGNNIGSKFNQIANKIGT